MDKLTGIILLRNSSHNLSIYGISTTERLRRQLKEVGCHTVLTVSNSLDATALRHTRAAFVVSDRLILDDRILSYLVKLDSGGGRLQISEVCAYISDVQTLSTLSEAPISLDDLERRIPKPNVALSDIESYVLDLRLKFEPYVFVVDSNSDIRQIENHMYEANFKGTLDFIATYVYKYPVREITRVVSHYPRLTPNMFTALSIVCSFSFPVLFAFGYVWQAILTGWIMFLADSVDGKLARLTVRLSRLAGIIEHGTSAPAIFLWFFGMGWYLSDGMVFDLSNVSAQAMWILMSLYWVDKLLNGLFRARYGRDMYDFTRIDKLFHLFACRRAIIWFFMFLGLMLGKLHGAFHALAVWMILSFLFHLYRLIWLSATVKPRNMTA